MKNLCKILLIPVFALLFNNAFSQTLTAKEIVQKSRDAMDISGLESTTTLTITDEKGNERVREVTMANKTSGDVSKRIIIFTSPADVKGTGILIFDYENQDDDMWIYLPALRKTRRIVSSEKSSRFMGSEFTNADLGSAPIDDFAYELLGTETVNSVSCYKIQITPNDDEIAESEGYSKKIMYIGKTDYVFRKITFYDLDEELLKNLTVSEVKMVDTKNKLYMTTEMTMENIQTSRKSSMKITEYELNAALGDDYFTTDFLEKQ